MGKENKQATNRAIVVLSTLQIFAYVWLLYSTYVTNHDSNPSDYGWMGGFVPAALFVLFGFINIIFFVIYAIHHIRDKRSPETIIVVLGVGLMALYAFLGPMINLVDSL